MSLAFALVNGLDFQSYYIFYGGFVFALVWVGGMRWLYERATDLTLAALGRSRRAILVGSGEQIEAVARALSANGSATRYETARLHLAHAAARERAARPRPARGPAAPARRARGARGHHRRPRLPAGGGVRARGPLQRARRRSADRAHDDGDPDARARARAGADRAAVRAQAAGVRGHGLRGQADVRPRRRRDPAGRALAPARRDRARGQADLQGPGAVPQPAARHRRPAVRLPQVPHDAHGRGAAPGRARAARTRPAARCSRSRATRA